MLKIKDLTEVREQERGIALYVFTVVLSFVASMGKIMGYPSPVNVVVAVVSGSGIIPAFLGAVLYYLLFGGIESGIIQLCSVLVIAAVRFIFIHDSRQEEPVFMGVLTAGVMMLFSCVMSVAVPADTYTASIRMLTSLMCGSLVFLSLSELRRVRSKQRNLSTVSCFGAAILYFTAISTLSGCPLPIFNLGRIFGSFALLAAARRYRTSGGAIVGALTTCGVLLCDPSLARNTLLLAVSGLICGAFVQFGRAATAGSFMLFSVISLVAVGVNGDTYCMFADLLAGTVLYIVCPVQWIKKTAAKFICFRNSADLMGQTACSRLNFASKALGEVRSQITLVSAAAERKSVVRDLKSEACSAVCGECPMHSVCMKKSPDVIEKAFGELEKIAVGYNGISCDDVRRKLSVCIFPESVAAAVNGIYRQILDDRAENIRIGEMREMLSEQLFSIEEILSDLSCRVGQVREVDSQMSAAVRDYFSNLGYPNARVGVFTDENGCCVAEVYLTADFAGDLVRLTLEMGEITECDFDIPSVTQSANVTRMIFNELPFCAVETGTFQASSTDNGYSGDTLEIAELSSCEKYVLLSDGMGTGKRAKLDSMFAVNLACRLLKGGLSMESAHRLINSVLRVKGWEESFATLDLLRLDLHGACAQFLKAGAAPAYLFRDGALKKMSGQSFPVGILNSCRPDVIFCKLFPGDVLIMTSDGADESDVRKITGSIREESVSAEKIAAGIGETAMNRGENCRRDDISVAVIKVVSTG